MKKTLKFLSSILLISTLGLVNCHKYETGGSSTNGYLIGSYINGLIRTAVTGNCAISLNLASLYAGAIFQGAVSSTTTFTQTQYENASGTTITAQGYSSYALVPFNKKYDAFLNNTSAWTESLRNTSLATAKASTDLAAISGAALILTSSNTSSPPTNIFNGRTSATDSLKTFWDTFSTAEKTALATAGSTTVATIDGVLATTGTTFQTNAHALFGAVLCNAGAASGASGNTSTACNASTAGYSAGASSVASAYMARSSWRSGMALLGCSRIPRSSCSLSAISTASLSADISGQANVANTLINTAECRKNTSTNTTPTRILTALFAGLSKDTVVTQGGFTYQNSTLNADGSATTLASVYGATEGSGDSSSTAFARTLIASKAYPKSSALASLGFGSAFPLATGATAYPVTTGTAVPTSQTANNTTDATSTAGQVPWYGGSNINLTPVTSCESLGLGSVGPTPVTTTVGSTTAPTGTLPAMTSGTVDTSTTQANRKVLTDVKEILYAFSSQNTAASTYAALNGVTYSNATGGVMPVTTTGAGTQGYEDAVACNTALRKTVSISSALGVGTSLASISAASGDGSASTLLTACIYGGTTTSRTSAAAILASSLFNITSCPTAAAAGASTFGEYGLTSLSTTTTANAIDGKQ